MRHAVIAAAALVAISCSSVEDRAGCAASSDCPGGQYCARTPDGGVCWEDRAPPSVADVTAACAGSPCLRDGSLHVEARAADGEELASVEVTLDLDEGARRVAMTRAGERWSAELPLREWPFEAFARPVVATVTARDGAGNEQSSSAAAVQVTRLRWIYEAGVPLSPPAVMDDGTVVVGLSRTSDQLVAIRKDGTKAWSASVGDAFVTAPPAVGVQAIWVGGEDFWLRGVAMDGSGALQGVGVNLEGAVRGGVSVSAFSGKEWGIGASVSGRLGAASTAAGEIDKTTATSAYLSGTVSTATGKVCAAGAGATSTLRCFDFDGALAQIGAVNVGVNVVAPLAVGEEGDIWSGSQDGKLNRSSFAGGAPETSTVADLAASITDSPVIARGGEVLVGDETGLLHLFDPAGTALWQAPANLGGAVLAPMLLQGAPCPIIASTRDGSIHALRGDGSEAWSADLTPGAELRAGNIFTEPGQGPSSIVSTALFAGADGKLYAVIVDGRLDTSAPWPKAFHDPRNTNNAGTLP